jgi:hypothetical protein
MSTQAPSLPGPDGSFDLPRVGRGGRLARRARPAALPARAALALLVLAGTVLALGAAHTPPLLPESLRPLPPALSSLGGVFYGLGIDLHVGGAILALVLMFGAYAIVVGSAQRLSARSVLIAVALLDVLVLLGPPMISTDVFSYQAYARMGALYHINPYTHGPVANFYDPVYDYVGSDWYKAGSAYGPVFTVFTYALARLSIPVSVFLFKAIAAAALVGVIPLVWRCAQRRGTHPVRAVAVVGLNPLLIIYAIGGGHNDLLMLLALVGGLYAILLAHERVGGALGVLAAGIKLTAGVVLPFALAAPGADRRGPRRNLLLGAGVAIAAVGALSAQFFGTGSIDMLATIDKSQSEGGWQSIPGFIATRLHLVTVGHITGYVLAGMFVGVFLWLLRRVWRGQTDWLEGAGWAMLAMLVASSSLLPWYVTWLLPLAGLSHDRRLVRWTVALTGAVLAVQMLGYIPHGTV